MVWLPDEAKCLPPPGLANRNSLWFGLVGYLTAITHNSICRYPALRAGVHRQVLFTTIGVFVGYYLTKKENYEHAKRDRELSEYVRQHPEDFQKPEKKTMAEVLEKFVPIR
ncbi:NADH dehydrogenase [ubiquinone] 1 subunit C2 [Spea bombifrons]|uniref:NADH dehydrogenase [ubiquinone] 1 subunit C2 n=1 Tax=Spea bombifrons TaxID=233779 RepID=UPI002349CE64|nr:NADH dehydrogenase [ubiquinone] 1 subunit C2 [Spea bombifrons]